MSSKQASKGDRPDASTHGIPEHVRARKEATWETVVRSLDAAEQARRDQALGRRAIVTTLVVVGTIGLVAMWALRRVGPSEVATPGPSDVTIADAQQQPLHTPDRLIGTRRIAVVQSPTAPVAVESLDDEGLLEELDRAGFSHSLTRVGDLVRVLYTGRAASR